MRVLAVVQELVFWGSFCAVAGTYIIYPLVIGLLAKLRGKPAPPDPAQLPSISLIVSAFNEAAVIRNKIENALSLDYPAHLREIMIISDASDDGTDEIVQSYCDRGVVLYRQDPRKGKSAGLTRFVPQAKGKILIFSDANSIYEPRALRNLVRHFEDPRVGFVAGHQRYESEGSEASESESLYWRYESWIKIQESRVGSVVCGDGAIYAARAELFEPLRDDDINDFTLPLKIISRGYRGLFDKEAVCYEKAAPDFGGEFRRKVRIVNRSFRAVLRERQTLNPFRVGAFSLQLLMHKVVRWFVPFFLIAMFVSNLAILAITPQNWFYWILLAGQILFYTTALLHRLPALAKARFVYVPYYFCLVNIASALGILGVLTGRRITTWKPERTEALRPQEKIPAEPAVLPSGQPLSQSG